MAEMHPILFHAGALLAPTYGAVMAVGLIACLLLALRCARQQGLAPGEVWNASVISVFCGAIGGKLWMVATNWAAFRAAPALVLNLSAVGGGAQGRVGAFIALFVFLGLAWRSQMPVRSALDSIAAPVTLLLAFQSLGCWFAGCGYGTPAVSGWTSTFRSPYAFVWWGTPIHLPLHAVQLESVLFYLALSVFLLWVGTWGLRSGRIAAFALLGGGFAEFLLQFWRGDVEALPWLPAFTVTQMVCLAMIAAGGCLLYTPRAWREATA